MRRKLVSVLIVLLIIVGFGVLTYPVISNQWNTYRQSQLITHYEHVVEAMEPEDFSEEWEKAQAFNVKIEKNDIYGDIFGLDNADMKETEYWQMVNIAGDGVMGYISIPKINLRVSIYHSTGDDVLQTGVGHLSGSALPIGGVGTHSILAGHRGLPTAKLFTDVDQLQRGDMFYIHVLDETLAYQVDQILDMVDKDDMETLQAAMQVEEGQDYVTLFTCTPYGVNSHRLLVRGTRVPYNGEEDVTASIPEAMVQSIQNYYMFYLIIGVAAVVLIVLLMRRTARRRERQAKKE